MYQHGRNSQLDTEQREQINLLTCIQNQQDKLMAVFFSILDKYDQRDK
jgi:hypothetical protein